MVSSLIERSYETEREVVEIAVGCPNLSTFLAELTHSLKLRIRGMEEVALVEEAPMLRNVQYSFL